MEYVYGGFTISNYVIGGTIEAAMYLVPTFKAFKTTAICVAMMYTTAKYALARAICSGITKATLGYLSLSTNRVLGVIKAFTGFSIGAFIAKNLVDPLDGDRNNGGLKIW
ncbi:MAG: hypothetical protein GX275_04935 [Clostridiales bacterium]|nr:hypothetical protein [Clostridiales bacterium]